MEYDSNKNQEIKRRFVSREVIACASTLVHELSQKAEHFPDYEEDLYTAYEGLPDYEEAARNEGWQLSEDGTFFLTDDNQYFLDVDFASHDNDKIAVSVYHVTEPGQGARGKMVWSFNGSHYESENLDGTGCFDITDPDELEAYLCSTKMGQDWALDEDAKLFNGKDCGFYLSYSESWEGLCEEQNIDAYEYRSDILEHWIVTDWLADKLEAHGERVLRDFFGFTIWCRSTSGQAILLDHVISVICEEMGILEGQANEWSV